VAKRGRKPMGRVEFHMTTDDPPTMLKMAENRCRFMLHNLRMIDFDLMRLIVSAYMQGVVDTAQVAFQNGFIPPGYKPELFIDAGEGI
jgi:hypothetical protein